MKKIPSKKMLTEPLSFRNYRLANTSERNWDSFRNSAPQAYNDLKRQLFQEQGEICAYCEEHVPGNRRRIEHFHPKSDTASSHNWTLDWCNMLGVCMGGEYEAYSRPANLSCDSYKNHLIITGQLSEQCDHDLLNPYNIVSSENLFCFNPVTGEITPNEAVCNGNPTLISGQTKTTLDLVRDTICFLNLNCARLKDKRRKIHQELQRWLRTQRQKHRSASQAKRELAKRWFSQRWPSFFTTRRCLLANYAEEFLRNSNYNG